MTCLCAKRWGIEMMTRPMKNLPPLALEFAKHLCAQVGMCAEVLLTAWCVYAQCILRLPCSDSLYQARPEDVEWFRKHRK